MRIRTLVLLLLLAPIATLAGEAEEAYRAKAASFGPPSATDAFEVAARFLVQGRETGTCRLSATPAEIDGAKVWMLRDRVELDFGGATLAVDSLAYADSKLNALRGDRTEVKGGESRRLRWYRTEEGYAQRPVGEGAEAAGLSVLAAEGDAVTTLSALVLFCRLAMPEEAEYAMKTFDPDPDPAKSKVEDATLVLEGVGEWKDGTAFLATGTTGGRVITVALDPKTREFLGMEMTSPEGMVAEIVPIRESAPEEEPDPLLDALRDPPVTGMVVLRVVPGTQSEDVGIAEGDVLVSYDGKPTTSMEAVNEAKAGAEGKDSVPVVINREGEEMVFEFAPGSLGVYLFAVKKGEPAPPLPPATDVAFDFSPLREGPRDEWYAFTFDGETKVGFEHGNLSLDEKGRLVYRREVAFDGGEQWGLNHFLAKVTATADARPLLLATRFENPREGTVAEGVREEFEDGTAEWRLSYRNETTDESGEIGAPGRRDYVSDYLVEALVPFMPREKGACFHFRPIGEGTAFVGPPGALFCAGKVEVEIRGETVSAWLYEQHRMAGGVTGRYYVGDGGQVLLADYGGPKAVLGERAGILEGLHEELTPRGVK